MQDVKSKIKKLKRHEQSAREIGSEEEAEAFAAEIQRLASEHKIDIEEVELEDGSFELADESIGKEKFDPSEYGGPSNKQRVWWQEKLSRAVALAFDCKRLVYRGSNRVAFVGYESDRKCAGYVFCNLVRTVEKLADRAYQRAYRNDERTDGFYTEFYRGFVQAIRERLRKQKHESDEKAEREGQLQKVERARERVREWVEKNLRTSSCSGTSSSRKYNRSARKKGEKAGRQANIQANGIDSKTSTSKTSKLPS